MLANISVQVSGERENQGSVRKNIYENSEILHALNVGRDLIR